MDEKEYLKTQENNIRVFARKRIAEIKRFVKAGKITILDLGSNWGFYLDEYRKEGWDGWGVELSGEYPKDNQVLNIDIRDINIDTFPVKFDVISAYCVLEHIKANESYKLLYTLSKILNDGGIVSIKAPYCKGLTARFAPDKYFLDPNHLQEIVDPEVPGLALIHEVAEGVHPERVFPRLGNNKAARWLTKFLGLGDAKVWILKKQ